MRDKIILLCKARDNYSGACCFVLTYSGETNQDEEINVDQVLVPFFQQTNDIFKANVCCLLHSHWAQTLDPQVDLAAHIP